MFKKFSKKPNGKPVGQTDTEESDAILSKIDASVYRRANGPPVVDRGRDRTPRYDRPMNEMGLYGGRDRAATDIPQTGVPYGEFVKNQAPFVDERRASHVNKAIPPLPQLPLSPTSGEMLSTTSYHPPQMHTPPKSPAIRPAPAPVPAAKSPALPALLSHVSQSGRYKHKVVEDPKELQVVSLAEHLFQVAFSNGEYYDVELKILSKAYRLHRVVLSRFAFFRQLFAIYDGNSAATIVLEVPDSNINEESVEIVLASIYGLVCPVLDLAEDMALSITPSNILVVLAASIFFQHEKLTETCLNFIIEYDLAPHHHRTKAIQQFPCVEKAISPTENVRLLRYIEFIDRFDYGSVTESMEDALLNYLCLEGYSSLEDLFVSLPIAWLERVLEADAFWCPNEFSRYQFAKTVILKRKLKNAQSTAAEIVHDERSADDIYNDIFRFAIIYTHMTFEQLNEVRVDNFVSEGILMKSLWHQTRLRSCIENGTSEAPTDSGIEGASQSKKELTTPIRLGIEFRNFRDIAETERIYSSTFFYAGSWWSVFMQKFTESITENGTLKPEKWGIFLRRSEGTQIMRIAKMSSNNMPDFDTLPRRQSVYEPDMIKDPVTGAAIEKSVSYYLDRRREVTAVFKLFNPSIKSYDPIFESKPNDYTETQSWGFRSRDNVVSTVDLAIEPQDALVRLSVVMKYV